MIRSFSYIHQTRVFDNNSLVSSLSKAFEKDGSVNTFMGNAGTTLGNIGKGILANKNAASAGIGSLTTAARMIKGDGFFKSIGKGVKAGVGANIGLRGAGGLVKSYVPNSSNSNQDNTQVHANGTTTTTTPTQNTGSGNK